MTHDELVNSLRAIQGIAETKLELAANDGKEFDNAHWCGYSEAIENIMQVLQGRDVNELIGALNRD